MLPCLQETSAGVVLHLQVQSRSSKNQLVGLHGDLLKVKLTSPPVDGAANKCCCEYLAKIFRLSKSNVELISGDKARQKRILLHGLDPTEAETLLNSCLYPPS